MEIAIVIAIVIAIAIVIVIAIAIAIAIAIHAADHRRLPVWPVLALFGKGMGKATG
jgi:hypothetical protein